jgi:hypothetical protein
MDLVDFLSAVVPPGRIIVARMVDRQKPDGKKYKGFSHIVCSTHVEAAATALSLAEGGHDVYFALASYKQGFHQNEKGKRVVRVRENVQELKALWFDIDFKGEYPDATAAVTALAKFCAVTTLPRPAALVGSGNGVHAYWPFDTYITLERWQRLADSLKEAAKALGLKADLVCTADACRVLRPPGTTNFKDPTNPKPVRLLFASGQEYNPDDLEAALAPWQPTRKAPAPATALAPEFVEFTGGTSRAEAKPSTFAEIAKHCAVSKWMLDTGGEACSEPEWMAGLQLLKHCSDGDQYAHQISKGHPKYDETATEAKWQARLANSAGPTLCKTFETYRPEMCAKCPHSGFIKTPLQVGYEGMQDVMGLPPGWRYADGDAGVERLMLTDPANNVKEWVKQFSHVPMAFRPVRSVATGMYDMMLDVKLKNTDPWSVILPMSVLGNYRKMVETLAAYGVVLRSKEIQPFGDLMATWLKKLQSARRVADVTEQLGWIRTGEQVSGFACSPTVYHSDGRVRNDVRPSREFASLAKMYEPRGDLDAWKKVAKFVADQNNPALTAVLAASFGAPLLKFVGIQGGILSLVSSASGVGKSSVLKLSQAVWGSPIHAMNSVDDTPKSVAKKLGFLNNLPAYWDELRGKPTVDGFCTLAFQITQGREKSRLDSAANLRDAQTWETMLVVAANESIFEAMARRTIGSDAGMVRTFEIEMTEVPQTDSTSAEVTLLFEGLSQNYGHAGRVYAQYLATHADEVDKLVKSTYLKLAGEMESAERFWFGMMAILLVGASLAKKLDLVTIDIRKLHSYLVWNLDRLRGRTSTMAEEHTMQEVLADYLRDRGNSTLVIDKFYDIAPPPSGGVGGKGVSNPRLRDLGRPPKDYVPNITEAPKSGKTQVVVATKQQKVRFATRDFTHWLSVRDVPAYGMLEKLESELKARRLRTILGLRTSYAGPRISAMEIDLNEVGSWNPGGSRDSSTSTEPED